MKLKDIRITICEACLDGIGECCWTPGCAMWMHEVDLAFDPRAYEVIQEFEEPVRRAEAAGIKVIRVERGERP